MKTLIVHTACKSTLQPAGSVEISVCGEMRVEDAKYAIVLLKMVIKQIWRAIDKASEEA